MQAGLPAAASVRRARVAVSVVFLVHGGMLGTWATEIPLVKERLGLDPATLGLALVCSALGGVAAMQFASELLRRFGALALLRASAVLGCLALPLAVVSNGASMLGAVLLLFGAGLGLVDLLMNAQAVEVERRAGRPIMSGLHGMWSLGALAGALLGSILLAALQPFWQALLLGACGGALLLRASASMLEVGGDPPEQRAPRLKGLLLRPGLLLTGAMMALAFAIEGALLDWGAIFLREVRHLPKAEAGLGFAAFAGSALLGRLGGDRARASWGDRRVLLGAVPAGFFLAVAALAPSAWLAVAGFGLTGIFLCNLVPILFNAAGTLGEAAGPGGATQAVAGVVSFGYGGIMAAPPLFGFIARQTSLPVALCVAAFCCLALGLASRALPLRA